MMIFWKAAAIVVLTVILGATIEKKEKDLYVVLMAAACCTVSVLALEILSDVISFVWTLSNSSRYRIPFGGTLLRITGVALVSELTGLISADAGSSSLGKAMDFLGNAVILSLALPLFESFIDVILEILNII